jgi:hypothetical protein
MMNNKVANRDGAGNVLYKWEQLWGYRPRILVFCPWRGHRTGLVPRMLPRCWVMTLTTWQETSDFYIEMVGR